LDLLVDDVAHVAPARVGEDAAIAEGARPPLHPALEPADDHPVGELGRRRVTQCVLVVDRVPAAAALVGDLARADYLRDFISAVLGAPVGMAHPGTDRAAPAR